MSDNPRAFVPHDHAHCASDVLRHAEDRCAAEGLRLTPVRRRTLEILAEAHRAMGAYDVLERLNAFPACMHPGTEHTPAFFICRECDAVEEAPVSVIRQQLDETAAELGFQVERVNLEAMGLCPGCAAEC